jgi:hypothetical protein
VGAAGLAGAMGRADGDARVTFCRPSCAAPANQFAGSGVWAGPCAAWEGGRPPLAPVTGVPRAACQFPSRQPGIAASDKPKVTRVDVPRHAAVAFVQPQPVGASSLGTNPHLAATSAEGASAVTTCSHTPIGDRARPEPQGQPVLVPHDQLRFSSPPVNDQVRRHRQASGGT